MRLLLLTLCLVGCDDGDAAADGPLDGSSEAGLDAAPPTDGAPQPDLVSSSADAAVDLGGPDLQRPDAAPPDAAGPPLRTRAIAEPPADLLEGSGLESCGRFLETRCVEGRSLSCEVYDSAEAAFVEPDALLRRVLLYERWYELAHSPDGMTVDRRHDRAFPADTPEAEWLDPERFVTYSGYGDSAIWTGVALHAFALRYLETGTEADYERMAHKTRQMLSLFEVTGIPGFLARAHFGVMPPGSTRDPSHLLPIREEPVGDHRDHLVEPAQLGALPAAYRAPGVTAVWQGNPSIDQYSGPMVALPLVWDLLRDAELKASIVEHLTCYLKRLRRIELVNLQANPEIIGALQQLLGGGQLVVDPGDIDFAGLERVVGYYLEQPNETNRETFDRSCPERLALQPTRVIDLGGNTWLPELFALAQDLQSRDNLRPGNIEHFYAPSVRAGDAVHLLHLAAMAFHFTGEAQYRDFFNRELIGELRALDVADTAAALQVPSWCRSFFGGHITYPAWFSLIRLLDEAEVEGRVAEAMYGEMWQRSRGPLADAKFDLMFAAVGPRGRQAARQMARDRALDTLRRMGGHPALLDSPRRRHGQDAEAILQSLGEATRCPSPEERATCESGFELLGLRLPGEIITSECRGLATECVFEDGLCAPRYATEPLPVEQRRHSDFIWQRNPYAIGQSAGHEQSPGLDLIEPYWIARHTGALEEGAGQALAWRTLGACE